LAVGRFVPEKGLHVLIEAFQMLDDRSWKLVVAGRADHEDIYSSRLLEEARKNVNIIMTGFLPEARLRELYSHAGLFVLPSFYEGMCLALLEALSYGLPCLVSDIPGNRGLPMQSGAYFKVGNIVELRSKMQHFLSGPSLSTEEKRQQIDIVSRKFDWQTIARQTQEVYAKALAPTPLSICSRKADRCKSNSALLCANFGTRERMHHG
jgi:glycosyltransferase involved in cell wall biosynthesis